MKHDSSIKKTSTCMKNAESEKIMNLADFANSKTFEIELKKLSTSMQKLALRAKSDITYRTSYNKRADVKATRATYMKTRNASNARELKLARKALQNNNVRKAMRAANITL